MWVFFQGYSFSVFFSLFVDLNQRFINPVCQSTPNRKHYKMSVNPEALQKLLMEMDNQLNKSKAELNMCNLQLDRINTNLNLIKHTSTNLKKLTNSDNDPVWQGIGKAFVKNDVGSYIKTIQGDEKEFLDTQKNLKTKQHYLQTTLDNTITNMTQLVGKK